VIKVLWGADWDPLFEKDTEGVLAKKLEDLPDGQLQKYTVAGGDYIRKDFFGRDKGLSKLVENYSAEQLWKLRRGGHDPQKVYNAFAAAVQDQGVPTVVLAQTIKGYGLGEAGEGKNITHQQKKLNEEELRYFRGRFGIPISDEDLKEAPFHKLDENSEEFAYLEERRKELGGYLPKRTSNAESLAEPEEKLFTEFYQGSGERDVATTMVAVQILGKLLKDKTLGERIVPIVPDESRTFGMEALFRQAGIYSHQGQQYEPVDKESLLYYKEDTDGAILEEGITEAGCMSSFIAAGTAYSTFGIQMVPFFFFYSMFGFQRIGDLVWAAGDARARGFMIGGTSGRTTLPGEGLQHADGQSHVYALSLPSLKAYDPAYAYEVAVIIREGFRRMFIQQEDLMYYITVTNETYRMPEKPDNAEEGILKGMYKLKSSGNKTPKVRLLASGALVNEALRAKELLLGDYDIPAEVWSVTSFKELYTDCTNTERRNMLESGGREQKNYIQESFEGRDTVYVAATDYLKALPLSVSKWIPGESAVLGTDGFGRSDNRGALRGYFEVDYRHMTAAALSLLLKKGELKKETVKKAWKDLEIDPEKMNPADL
jgi:pyruvate dehydrogenase E1 component